ncbi:TetR/AcrR family transcriptional regulator [Symbioplanes lichenis]|uniref:TetR/AcrR family transcriptional regulator n=1 Tax=Symbioplanes lichenis TaxID=1629072 RepID=UPI0027381A9D|nr:TetR/AcrR family transcriptional regulator [Actinoplanes lichenis]
MSPEKPLRADARRNREALVAKAREIFAAGDFDLRFDDFAKLAGVGTGTLYRHFPTREALAEAVYREELTAMVARAGELRKTHPPAEALAAFLRGVVDLMYSHQGLARTLATLMSPQVDVLAEGDQTLGRAVAELMTAAAEAGAIRADVGAGAVMLAVQGICTTAEHPSSRADADDIITVVLDGLRREAAP